MKKWLVLLLLPVFLFSQNQEGTQNPEDSESLVEIKTLNDLIQSKEIIEDVKKEEPKEEKKEEPKDKMIEPEKIDKKDKDKEEKKETKKPLIIAKQEKKNANVFDGKLSSDEILVEKKGKNLILWIKQNPKIMSAALISPSNWNLRAHYFLRSPKKISEQKNNTLWYNGLPLGNEKKLYFLASSSPKKHPLLGNAFQITVPERVTFGYNKKTGFKWIVPGKTDLVIRLFKKKEGQGGYKDNRYRIPLIEEAKLEKSEIKVLKIEKKDCLVGLSFLYEGNSSLIQQMSIETEKNEILLHDFAKNLTYPKYFQITELSFNKNLSVFKMNFIVIFNTKKNKKFLLKIKTDKETVSLPIDMDSLEQPKEENIEPKEESAGKKEETTVKEIEKKSEPVNEVKKEENQEINPEKSKKNENLPDELNLKVQGEENK